MLIGKLRMGIVQTVFFFFASLLFAFSAILFGMFFFAPVHETGHVFGALLVGEKILHIDWWHSVQLIASSDWRDVVVGFMGGFTSCVSASLVYIVPAQILKVLRRRRFPFLGVSEMMGELSLLAVKVTLMVVASTEFVFAVLEGFFPSFYSQFTSPKNPYVFFMVWIFSLLSLFLQLQRLIKNGTEALFFKTA
jgi:hypothetical protein